MLVLAFGMCAAGALPVFAQESPPTKEQPPDSTTTVEPAPAPDGPQLYVSEIHYTGGNGDQTPDPGERLDVLITSQNGGNAPATDVSATIEVSETFVDVITATATWPDIAAGASAPANSPFVIQIASDAPRGEGCNGTNPGVRPIGSPVASDDVVSSDGSASSGSGGAPAAGVVLGSEPGAQATAEPATVKPDPAQTEPAPSEPAPQPEPAQPNPVGFEAKMTIAASGTTYESAFGTQMVCMYSELSSGTQRGAPSAPSAPRGGTSKPVASDALERTGAHSTGTTSAAAIAAVLAATAAALVLRRVLLRTR